MTTAFDEIIHLNEARLRNICRSYADVHEQEDLLQEIYEQLWRSQKSFKGDSSVSTWLYRVAINTAVSYQRKKIQIRNTQAQAPKSRDVAKQGLADEEMITAFSSELSEVDRSIFVLYVNGLNTEAMSEVIGLSGNAIKVRITRMKVKFRQQFVD